MSLVNDMLRDLDNRRKETGGSTASVKLTPAPEVVPDLAKRPIIFYLVVALVIGAGAIAWFWTQRDGGGTTRQLDIAPQIVSQPVIESPVESPVEEVLVAESDSETPAIGAGDQDDVASETSIVEEPEQRASEVASNIDSADGEPVMPMQSESTIDPSQPSQVVATGSVGDSSEEPNDPANSPEQASSTVVLADNSTVTEPTLNQIPEPPPQAVKNSAELTPEENDLLAVQDALRLIADNKKLEAYELLEEQIIANRYAHQSRETYAKLLIQEQNLLGAYELNEAGLALSPNHSGFKKIKARVLIADGQIDAAVELLLTRAPAVDADLEYHDILATAQLATRDYEGALISYTGLVQQDQTQGKWWYGFAASQDSLGNAVAAIQGYSQAVRLPNLSANLRRRSQERLALLSQ